MNLQYSKQLRYLRKANTAFNEDEVLPVHKNMLSGAFAGKDAKRSSSSKGVIEGMPGYCHFKTFTFKQKKKPSWADEKYGSTS